MLKETAPVARRGGVARARELRRAMTLPEVLLWQALRHRPGGLKFRRQHPSGAYVLDFYCTDARLAIEVDGAGHEGRADRDTVRDAWFAAHGIATLRVPAKEVLADIDAVCDAVVEFARARLPLHHPARPDGPPPRA